jgi:preprotein translocase subunit SecA
MPEDIPLEHALVSRSIQQAQIKVEGFNFDLRKQVVEYDDVMNKQREIVYRLRKRILERSFTEEGLETADTKDLKEEIMDKIRGEIKNLVAIHAPEGYSEKELESIMIGFSEIIPFDNTSQSQIKKQLSKLSQPEEITELLMKIVNDIYEQREKTLGEEMAGQIERFVYLSTIDHLWIDHLTAMDHLREGIGLRGYAQKDPLVEYKKEAFDMFERLVNQIDYEIVRKVFRIQVVQQPAVSLERAKEEKKEIAQPTPETVPQGTKPAPAKSKKGDLSDFARAMSALPVSAAAAAGKTTPVVNAQKIGRNDPCPCGATREDGTSKKYKHCCYPKFG